MSGSSAIRNMSPIKIFPGGKLELTPKTYVFVLCKCRRLLMPTTAPKARILLKQNRAKVFRLYPFTIQLNYETHHNAQPMEIRIDYGAKMHGIALVQECKTEDRAVFLGEARQRKDIKKKMDMRREMRRLGRYRKTRYRKPRFNNRRRPEDWVPPTIAQRVESITRIARTLGKLSSITSAVTEIGMFDTQKMNDPEIEGNEYQQGPGYGFENKKQATLAYFNYICQYCGTERGVMTVDHVIPTSQGGTDTWNNLTCACLVCNKKKNDRTPGEADMSNPKTVKPREAHFLKFCSLVQSGKTRLVNELKKLVPTQTVYGWQTRWNRMTGNLPKTHYFDAVCTRTIDQKPIALTASVYSIRLRRRNIRRTHLINPMKGGKRRPYNENKELQGYRKGDLVRTPHGLAYIVGILTSGQLEYQTIDGQIQKRMPKRVKLIESARGVCFFPIKEEARAKNRFGDQARPPETRVSDA